MNKKITSTCDPSKRSKRKRSKKSSERRGPIRADSKRNKIGRWEKWEHEAFLEGLRIHGQGKWKQISKMIPTRTTIQVKTHAQMYNKSLESANDRKYSVSESSYSSSSDVDEMTVSTMDSSSTQSHRSVRIPVVITLEASPLPIFGTPRLNMDVPSFETPRLKTAAYILATLNQTFIQRNQCFK